MANLFLMIYFGGCLGDLLLGRVGRAGENQNSYILLHTKICSSFWGHKTPITPSFLDSIL